MKIFENRGDVVKFSMTSNHPGNSVLNHLNFVNVLFRDTVQQTVAIVNSLQLASDSDKFKIIITLRRAQKKVPEMVTPASRTTAVLLVCLNLTNMPCSVLP